jgi:hypothetical protein
MMAVRLKRDFDEYDTGTRQFIKFNIHHSLATFYNLHICPSQALLSGCQRVTGPVPCNDRSAVNPSTI